MNQYNNKCLKIFCVLLFLLISGFYNVLLGQTIRKEFSLNDSVFAIGEVYRFDPVFLYTTKPLREEKISEILQPIKEFLEKNPELIIEIGAHTNTRADSLFNKNISEKRALMVYKALIRLGLDSCRIYWRGYGEEEPIISHEIIRKLENAREREFAHRLNRRIELKIIAIKRW